MVENGLKINKSTGIDDISYNVVSKCFGDLGTPLKHIFDSSFENGIFPDSLKIARVTPLYKSGDSRRFSNYRPVSVLSCFSKMFERIIYTRLFNYLLKKKSFILNNLVSKQGTQLVDLAKAFDTVDHKILLTKIEIYGTGRIILKWFESYSTNRKKYIQISNIKNTDLKDVVC